MNLKQKLDDLAKRAPTGAKTLAETYPDVTTEQIKNDIAEERQGKTMSLSFRDIDAEDEASPEDRGSLRASH